LHYAYIILKILRVMQLALGCYPDSIRDIESQFEIWGELDRARCGRLPTASYYILLLTMGDRAGAKIPPVYKSTSTM